MAECARILPLKCADVPEGSPARDVKTVRFDRYTVRNDTKDIKPISTFSINLKVYVLCIAVSQDSWRRSKPASSCCKTILTD